MLDTRKAPLDCPDMATLRRQIDDLDAQLVALLQERSTYIDRAIQLKPAEGLIARLEDRVEQVVANVRQKAETQGLDPDLTESLWRKLIDWSIEREEKVLGPGKE